MSILSIVAVIIMLIAFFLFTLLVFGMAQAAGKADELSERIYQKEMEKLERHKKMMEDVSDNPEYISTEDRKL